jgi:opacity protein-like surface antigen
MKDLLLGCAIAFTPIMQTVSAAADLKQAIASSVPCVPIMFNWTGFHIGAKIRSSWTGANTASTPNRARWGSSNQSAFIGGGAIGHYDQIGPELEWLMDGVGSDHSNNALVPAFGDLFEVFAREDWVATLSGRVGITAPGWDHWLVYVKGGVGWAETQAIVTDLSTGASFSDTEIDGAWAAGVDLEWAFAPNGTARNDHPYIGLSGFPLPDGQPSHPRPDAPMAHAIASDMFDGSDVNARMPTVGVRYLPNGSRSPVMARY